MKGSLLSAALPMPTDAGAFLQATSAQGSEPPPTSGNGMTVFLGLTAFSLVVVVVGAWLVRSMRDLLARVRVKRARGGHSSPSAAWPDVSGGPR